jgi:hypothetical protein
MKRPEPTDMDAENRVFKVQVPLSRKYETTKKKLRVFVFFCFRAFVIALIFVLQKE